MTSTLPRPISTLVHRLSKLSAKPPRVLACFFALLTIVLLPIFPGPSGPLKAAIALICTGAILAALWSRSRRSLVGPLFYYDLARLAQRGRTTQLRCFYLVVLAGILLSFAAGTMFDTGSWAINEAFLSSAARREADASSTLLIVFTLQIAALLILTPAYLAPAFTEEKERKTLQFLFTTDLTNHELVLGKLFGRLALIGTILLVALPFECFYAGFGLVENSAIWLSVAATVLSLLSTGSVCILCSILCRTTLGAVVCSYCLVFACNLFCFAVPGTSSLYVLEHCEQEVDQQWKVWNQEVNDYIHDYESNRRVVGQRGGVIQLTPLSIPKRPDSARIRFDSFVPFAIVHGCIFLICTLYCIWIVRAICLAPGHGAPLTGATSETPRVPRTGVAALTGDLQLAYAGMPRPSMPVQDDALLWKEVEFGEMSFPPSATGNLGRYLYSRNALVCWTLIYASLYVVRRQAPSEAFGDLELPMRILLVVGTCFSLVVWCLLLGIRIAGAITREREQETLLDLLMLPVSGREILSKKWWGGILRFGGIGNFLVLFWLVGMLLSFLHPLSALFLIGASGVYLAFVASIGLWISVASRSTLWANLSVVLALMSCSAGIIAKEAASIPLLSQYNLRWLREAPDPLISPGHAIYALTFSARAFDVPGFGPLLPRPDASTLRTPRERERARWFSELKLALVQLFVVSLAAGGFWFLAQWQFRKAYR